MTRNLANGLMSIAVVTLGLAWPGTSEACHRCRKHGGMAAHAFGGVSSAPSEYPATPTACWSESAPSMVPQQTTTYQDVTETVYDQVPVTRTETRYRTEYRTEQVPTTRYVTEQVPVTRTETRYRTEYRTENYTVVRQVPETVQVSRTVTDM